MLGDADNRGRVRCKTQYISRLPVPACSDSVKIRLTKLAERAAKLAAAEDRAELAKVEREIDEIVYRLFSLTPDEVAQIETSLANTRGGSSDDDTDTEDE